MQLFPNMRYLLARETNVMTNLTARFAIVTHSHLAINGAGFSRAPIFPNISHQLQCMHWTKMNALITLNFTDIKVIRRIWVSLSALERTYWFHIQNTILCLLKAGGLCAYIYRPIVSEWYFYLWVST